jgi:hypothetical protein
MARGPKNEVRRGALDLLTAQTVRLIGETHLLLEGTRNLLKKSRALIDESTCAGRPEDRRQADEN